MAQLISEKDPLARRIRRLVEHGAAPHAVILSGDGDRLAAGRYLAAALLCRSGTDRPCLHCSACRKVAEGIHPDLHLVQDPTRRELAVDAVRALRQDVYIRPNESERKVYLFADCKQLNETDQNVLLKIVEEGPAYGAYIFCAESAATLLSTIRSRCVEWKLRGDGAAAPCEQAVALCRAFAEGRVLPVMELLTQWGEQLKTPQVQTLLQDAWGICAQALLLRCGKGPESGGAGEVSALLSRALSRSQLRDLTDCLRAYARQCRYNAGPGHVLAALTARWEAILR